MKISGIVCPVCGKYTFECEGDYDICEYCGWENDTYTEAGGANSISLSEYKKRYEIYLYLFDGYTWKKNGNPELSRKDIARFLHQYSIGNRELIESSQNCGCFFCRKIFEKDLISEWLEDDKGKTAICPYCGIDSVLPDSQVALTAELLDFMYKEWFE